jgi:hypothetical protein
LLCFASLRFCFAFALLCFASLRFALLRFASLRFALLRFASLRFASLCFALLLLSFALLCFASLCFALLLLRFALLCFRTAWLIGFAAQVFCHWGRVGVAKDPTAGEGYGTDWDRKADYKIYPQPSKQCERPPDSPWPFASPRRARFAHVGNAHGASRTPRLSCRRRAGIQAFKDWFLKKTRNAWDDRQRFRQYPDYYNYIEQSRINKNAIKKGGNSSDGGKRARVSEVPSALPKAVAKLVEWLFDEDQILQSMKVLCEYCLRFMWDSSRSMAE